MATTTITTAITNDLIRWERIPQINTLDQISDLVSSNHNNCDLISDQDINLWWKEFVEWIDQIQELLQDVRWTRVDDDDGHRARQPQQEKEDNNDDESKKGLSSYSAATTAQGCYMTCYGEHRGPVTIVTPAGSVTSSDVLTFDVHNKKSSW